MLLCSLSLEVFISKTDILGKAIADTDISLIVA